ncbi:TlpA disulfide reductase family protein [Pedobacter frigidisoli]|uniref:TlpA disulfide reductase family protein n=1 Tax=Pedobacter frigidisoli TaxID=2530455 RepID=UPI002931B74A|nr:TlpA disulfide reductase family protein [Pedobacter frigidisoli]
MMKIFVIALAQLVSMASSAQNKRISNQKSPLAKHFHINGDVKNVPGVERIYLTFPEGKDSAAVVNGTFKFDGKLFVAGLADLQLKFKGKPLNKTINVSQEHLTLFLSEGNNTILVEPGDSFNQAKVTDSKWHKAYQSYEASLIEMYRRAGSANKEYWEATRAVNVSRLKKLKPIVDSLRKEEEEFVCNYIRNHGNSPVSLYAVGSFGRPIINAYDIENAYNLLSPELKLSVEGQRYKKRIADKKRFDVGKMLPGFAQPDSSGKMISLSDFKGKYVFIDLWASWCGPCRTQTPYVKGAAAEFKGKNFVVLAVSLDGSRQAWLKAIRDDDAQGMIHVGDMKDRKNAVALQYDIHAIPANFLIDPTGLVIARDLHELELQEQLQTIFKPTGK